MKIREMLERKGHDVVTVGPDETVASAIRLLVNHGIGSVVVVRDGEMVGILTERDVLRLTDRDPEALKDLSVEEAMTTDVIVTTSEDDVAYVMEVMTRNRVRHLPVVGDTGLLGIISIGDVVNAVRRSVEAENRYLRDYVQGMVR